MPALSLVSEPDSGTAGAILGYPENGPFDVQPGRIGRTQTVITQNAYGQGPVSRLLTPLRGLVRPGNSGGPLVDGAGQVLTTVFAGTVGGGPHGGYGVANATVAHVLAEADRSRRRCSGEHGAVHRRLTQVPAGAGRAPARGREVRLGCRGGDGSSLAGGKRLRGRLGRWRPTCALSPAARLSVAARLPAAARLATSARLR